MGKYYSCIERIASFRKYYMLRSGWSFWTSQTREVTIRVVITANNPPSMKWDVRNQSLFCQLRRHISEDALGSFCNQQIKLEWVIIEGESHFLRFEFIDIDVAFVEHDIAPICAYLLKNVKAR